MSIGTKTLLNSVVDDLGFNLSWSDNGITVLSNNDLMLYVEEQDDKYIIKLSETGCFTGWSNCSSVGEVGELNTKVVTEILEGIKKVMM